MKRLTGYLIRKPIIDQLAVYLVTATTWTRDRQDFANLAIYDWCAF